jgi:CheY-like chemotaxis protein
MMLRELLRECGYRVLEAASTDEAIAVLEKTAIPVDVVLSEIDIAGAGVISGTISETFRVRQSYLKVP